MREIRALSVGDKQGDGGENPAQLGRDHSTHPHSISSASEITQSKALASQPEMYKK